MKHFWLFLVLPVLVFSQKITVENIFSGKYYEKGIYGIQSMNDGIHYTILGSNGIEKFSYKTQQSVGIIASGSFSDYQFNANETLLLLEKESESIYRHSKLGTYEVLQLNNQQKTQLANGEFIQEPMFSPDATKIAFVKNNNIFIQNLQDNSIVQVTHDGKKNEVINGINDWVYEEEFGHVKAMEWNADGSYLVYVRFDESAVKQMNIPIYYKNLYPEEMKFKYPKAGEENAKVSLHAYQVSTKISQEITLQNVENYYIPVLKSSKDANSVFVITANRHQNKMDVLSLNPSVKSVAKLFTETDSKWIDTDKIDLEFLPNNSFIWASERSGYRHLYWYNANGTVKNAITKGNWDVSEMYGIDTSGKVYFQAAKTSPKNKDVYSISLNGANMFCITPMDGTNSASFSKSFAYFINKNSTINQPSTYTLRDKVGKEISILEKNSRVTDNMTADGFTTIEFLEIPNEANQMMPAWMIKPTAFNAETKYPVLMYVYGGPGSQEVSNSFDGINNSWFQMLAQNGIIVVCVDGRGTGYQGTAYKKATYKNLGKLEIEDQIAAAKWLQNQSYVNPAKIGMFGWSFGGYMTLLALTKGADVFSTGVSVAPVTNWRFYDTVYTERFLQTPQENADGYDANSPINFANKLKGNLLLVHGTADDNVHYQNSVEMSEALIQANKPFEQAYYPDKNHGIYGGKTRIHLYNKMTNFLLEHLKQ